MKRLRGSDMDAATTKAADGPIHVREKRSTLIKEYLSDDDRWIAVSRRDRRADGAFLYAVKTTGVYCRPTCSARRPKRGNVEFFASSEQAEREGYRACLKCAPKAAKPIDAAVLRACRMIEKADKAPTLKALAAEAGLSPFYFHKRFKAVVGVTPRAYMASRRVQKFRAGLRGGQRVTTALYRAGFGSSSRCYESVGASLGMTPTEYRRGGAGQLIRFAAAECGLGWVGVAATARGVCMIELGDGLESLRAEVAARFPKATLVDGDREFNGWVNAIVRQIEMPRRAADLPLDVQGTAFQRKVWEALRAIPAGATTTYAAIAQEIGRPGAVRAVANACAKNPAAVVIPCHRVVRSDGALSGYRWGTERKKRLLEREAGNDASTLKARRLDRLHEGQGGRVGKAVRPGRRAG